MAYSRTDLKNLAMKIQQSMSNYSFIIVSYYVTVLHSYADSDRKIVVNVSVFPLRS